MSSVAPVGEIFFHVGTGKTGSTFLQQRVFPKLEGICYIPTRRFKRAKRIIWASNKTTFLISREFDQQLETEVKSFSRDFRNVHPIIVFRRHDSYVASQYRRFVKNGYRLKFHEFFDLKDDKGHFKRKDLDYNSQIRILEEHFDQRPIVLIYDDLKQNPKKFIQSFSEIVGAQVNIDRVDFSRKHRSYSEKQLKVMQKCSRRFNLRKRRIFDSRLLHFFWKLYIGAIRYSILYIARLVPDHLLNDKPLIDPRRLEEVRIHYDQDWLRVLNSPYCKRV
jgi:hypothetical protein